MAIADAVKLQLYNGALRLLRETKLGSLSEAREPRRTLDDIWDSGALNHCLELGQWHFASRTVALTYDPDTTPAFGYQFAFNKPDDFVRLIGLSQDENGNVPLTQYRENGGFWFSDFDTIYLTYVSDDAAYGYDSSLWPPSFNKFVEAYLAQEVAPTLTMSEAVKQEVAATYKSALSEARSLSAMGQPTKFPPMGSWVRARNARNR